MKIQDFILSPKTSAVAAMLAVGLCAATARADEWTKRTVLTVNEPIQVKDTLLKPGKYTLRLIANSTFGVDRHVVQILDGNAQHIINTVVTQVTIRPHATGSTQFTWWETPPGTARALRDWYYPGETTGDEFPYPAHPQQIATVVPPPPVESAPAPVKAEAAPAPPPPPATEPAPTPETHAEVEPPPPPTPQQPAAAPAPPPEPAPTELPKTSSPYPLIGLCGLALAGLGGTLLLKRTA